MADNYFRLTSLEDGNQISIKKVGSPTSVNLQCRTSLDQTWYAYAIGTVYTLSTNQWIEFRNDTGTFSSGNSSTWQDYYNFTITKTTDASGSIMSLIDYNNMDMAVPGWAFYALFRYCSKLRKPPELPATSLGIRCYNSMFRDSGIVEMPHLPATTLAANCYDSMFRTCPNLTKVEIPNAALADSCFSYMFNGSTNVNEVKYMPSTFSTSSTPSWLANASSTGTFYYTNKNLDITSIPRNANGVPSGWSIKFLETKNFILAINGKSVSTLIINGKTVSKLG